MFRSMILTRRASLALFLIGISLFLVPWSKDSPLLDLHDASFSRKTHGDLNLHLLIPATSSNPNFCRTTLSAALLDYPTPIILNWRGREDREDRLNQYASHLAKIDRTLEYLRGLPPRNDHDLVLIVDGFDVWFQVRPEVLIQRYYEVIRRNNERLEENFESETLEEENIKQTVLFGADKKCWPQSSDSAACNVIPKSPLPDDIFGGDTDAAGEHHFARPRWVNSGTVLGPASDVRAIFEEASHRVQHHFHGYSDQWYFAGIFGDQEVRRNEFAKAPNDINQYFSGNSGQKKLSNIKDRTKSELHMSLDYDASLFHTNAFALDDTDWIIFNSTEISKDQVMKTEYAKANLENESRLLLPPDIGQSRPPISKEILTEELYEDDPTFTDLPYNTTWGDVPLLVNRMTGTVPAILHLNGDKKFLNEWWARLWWGKQGWGKHLLRSGSRALRGPLGVTVDANTGKTIRWWKGSYNSLRRENGGYWTAKGHWLFYNDVCAHYGDVLFNGKNAGASKQRGGWMGPGRDRHKYMTKVSKNRHKTKPN